MKEFIIAIGSNHDATLHLQRARNLLAAAFPGISFTKDLLNEAVDGGRGIYLNCLAKGKTQRNAEALTAELKAIEIACGDSHEARRQGQVSMDLDLLRLGEVKYHEQDWQRPYVRLLIKYL